MRATVEVEYLSDEVTIDFMPGQMDFESGPWATHPVDFATWTDEWVQHLSLHDRYVVEGSELVPASDATTLDYALSDEAPFGGSFEVEVDELSVGRHQVTLTVPVSLEPLPRHEGTLEARNVTLEVGFVYEVFEPESPLTLFCNQAGLLLWDQGHFAPEAFAEAGAGLLTDEQFASFVEAEKAFNKMVSDDRRWDPNQFFDLVEEICDVTYNERWLAMS